MSEGLQLLQYQSISENTKQIGGLSKLIKELVDINKSIIRSTAFQLKSQFDLGLRLIASIQHLATNMSDFAGIGEELKGFGDDNIKTLQMYHNNAKEKLPDLNNKPFSDRALFAIASFKLLGLSIKKIMTPVKNLSKEFLGIGVNMLKMKLVTAPMQAFWEGLLEPLEPIIELVGDFGSLLGLGLVPVTKEVLVALTPFIPMIADMGSIIGQYLGPAVSFILTPLKDLASLLKGEIDFNQFLIKIREFPTQLFAKIGEAIANIDWGLVKNIGSSILTAILAGLEGLVMAIATFLTNSWENLGTMVTGGGADKRGWW